MMIVKGVAAGSLYNNWEPVNKRYANNAGLKEENVAGVGNTMGTPTNIGTRDAYFIVFNCRYSFITWFTSTFSVKEN